MLPSRQFVGVPALSYTFVVDDVPTVAVVPADSGVPTLAGSMTYSKMKLMKSIGLTIL